MYQKTWIIRIIFFSFLSLWAIFLCPHNSWSAAETVIENKLIKDFYPVQKDILDSSWRYLIGPNGEGIQYVVENAKKYNLNPVDVAIILTADVASRQVWPAGIPAEVPWGFVQSQTGLSQIPPGMAVTNRLIGGSAIVNGARTRFQRYQESVLQPEEGVDYWFKSLADEAYERMQDPRVNINVATRYIRRVADAAYALYRPSAYDSLMLDIKDQMLHSGDVRWADEFDWGRLKKYMRDQRLWDISYVFEINKFAPSEDRLSEFNLMILYSEYRTAPPFDGSWFFEAMHLIRETKRWFDSNPDYLKMLEPTGGKMVKYSEFPEDYSFYQDEAGVMYPTEGQLNPKQKDKEKSEDEDKKKDDSDDKSDSHKRKPRGR